MAKKIDNPEVIVSKLIIKKDEFEKQIEDRILKGKKLLEISVKSWTSVKIRDATYLDSAPKRKQIIEYDEAEKNNFLSEYNKWKQFNVELLKQSFDIPNNEYRQEYEKAERATIWSDWIKERKEDISKQITVLESLIDRLPLIPTAVENTKNEIKAETKFTNKIFIVHGHNNEIKQTVARTLSQLKLEPIILHEQPEQGRTIIEKFEDNSSDVNFAIILLTADDEGKAKRETDYQTRARQNVVFEMGYFIGKLGRKKVFLLLENGVQKPGDLDGIVYVPIDDAEGWKLKLVRELKTAGYSVSADDL